MTDTPDSPAAPTAPAHTLPATPVKQSLPADQRPSKPRRVTGKLRAAIDAVIHEGLEMDQAAAKANMTTRNLRMALDRPWVREHMRRERARLIDELTAQNPHHLRTLRASSPNAMVKLGAARLVEEISGTVGGRSTSVNVGIGIDIKPGYVLDLSEHPEPPQHPQFKVIDGKANQ